MAASFAFNDPVLTGILSCALLLLAIAFIRLALHAVKSGLGHWQAAGGLWYLCGLIIIGVTTIGFQRTENDETTCRVNGACMYVGTAIAWLTCQQMVVRHLLDAMLEKPRCLVWLQQRFVAIHHCLVVALPILLAVCMHVSNNQAFATSSVCAYSLRQTAALIGLIPLLLVAVCTFVLMALLYHSNIQRALISKAHILLWVAFFCLLGGQLALMHQIQSPNAQSKDKAVYVSVFLIHVILVTAVVMTWTLIPARRDPEKYKQTAAQAATLPTTRDSLSHGMYSPCSKPPSAYLLELIRDAPTNLSECSDPPRLRLPSVKRSNPLFKLGHHESYALTSPTGTLPVRAGTGARPYELDDGQELVLGDTNPPHREQCSSVMHNQTCSDENSLKVNDKDKHERQNTVWTNGGNVENDMGGNFVPAANHTFHSKPPVFAKASSTSSPQHEDEHRREYVPIHVGGQLDIKSAEILYAPIVFVSQRQTGTVSPGPGSIQLEAPTKATPLVSRIGGSEELNISTLISPHPSSKRSMLIAGQHHERSTTSVSLKESSTCRDSSSEAVSSVAESSGSTMKGKICPPERRMRSSPNRPPRPYAHINNVPCTQSRSQQKELKPSRPPPSYVPMIPRKQHVPIGIGSVPPASSPLRAPPKEPIRSARQTVSLIQSPEHLVSDIDQPYVSFRGEPEGVALYVPMDTSSLVDDNLVGSIQLDRPSYTPALIIKEVSTNDTFTA
eukprot:m.158160 g.158160  ORF g.158160 m.158160 type:complete len:728 (+) comp16325_c0_seq3:117-2300(+)